MSVSAIRTLLTDDDRRVLLEVRGFIGRGLASYPEISAGVLKTIGALDRLISRGLAANSLHDAGAYARCSGCGRYTIDPNSLTQEPAFPRCVCDCGRSDFWCGSFVAPGEDARFSFGLPGTRDKRETSS